MNDPLLSALTEEHAAVEAFASLLALEQKALASKAGLATLPTIVGQKTELTQRLAALEKIRDAELAALGMPRGRKGIEMACKGNAQRENQWTLLRRSTERARVANLRTGMMIRTRMEHNRRALAILRGATTGGGGSSMGLYGPDGRVPGFGR